MSDKGSEKDVEKEDAEIFTENTNNQTSFEISTPKKADEIPLSNGLNAVDLNIVNLESTSDVRLDDRARSSPSVILAKDFETLQNSHRRTSSTGNLPNNAEDPEDRLGHGRQFSLDLGPRQDHVIVEIEQAKARKTQERSFKIIIGLIIFAVLFSVTFFMVAWELGYLNKSSTFSAPVFY